MPIGVQAAWAEQWVWRKHGEPWNPTGFQVPGQRTLHDGEGPGNEGSCVCSSILEFPLPAQALQVYNLIACNCVLGAHALLPRKLLIEFIQF